MAFFKYGVMNLIRNTKAASFLALLLVLIGFLVNLLVQVSLTFGHFTVSLPPDILNGYF